MVMKSWSVSTHQTLSGSHANCHLAISPVKDNSLLCQAVDIRRYDMFGSIAPKFGAQIIYRDEKYVRFVIR